VKTIKGFTKEIDGTVYNGYRIIKHDDEVSSHFKGHELAVIKVKSWGSWAWVVIDANTGEKLSIANDTMSSALDEVKGRYAAYISY